MRHITLSFIVILLVTVFPSTAEEELWIPAAASNPGRHGTMWTTDLWIHSRVMDAPIEVSAAFFPDQAGTTAPEESVIELDAGEHVKISDAVATLFGENRPGAIRLRSTQPFFAQTRTANDGGMEGSFGQGIPAFSADLATQSFTFLGAANRPGNDGIRTNIGIVNTGTDAMEVTIAARDATTLADLGVYRFDIGPHGWFQGDVFDLLGLSDQDVELADVSVLGRDDLLGYLSQIDNRSGDGTFIAASLGGFIRIDPSGWELVATLTYSEGTTIDWFYYDTRDGQVSIADPESGFTTGTLYFTPPATVCTRATGQVGAGPEWGWMEIKIDRRPIGDTWFHGRHYYSTEPNGLIDQQYCVEIF